MLIKGIQGFVRKRIGRYSPGRLLRNQNQGEYAVAPDEDHISIPRLRGARQTPFTMRMGMRRFTRLTNAFSKKVENHAHAMALHFMYYNFGRIHKTLRVTPAMEAGVSDHHVWALEEISNLKP